jgi:hypothetical protein
MVHVRAARAVAPRALGVILVACLTGSRADGGHLLVVPSRSTPEAAVSVVPVTGVAAAGGVILAPRSGKAGEIHRSNAAAKTAASLHASPLGWTSFDLASPPDRFALRCCRRSGRSPPVA